LLEEREALCRSLDERSALHDTLERLVVARECHELVAMVPSREDTTAPLKAERHRLVRETGDLDGRQVILAACAFGFPVVDA